MLNAALTQLFRWDTTRIQAYCGRLAEPVHHELSAIRPPDRIPAEMLYEALKARRVDVSLRGRLLRVSVHVFNSGDDVGALVEGLTSCMGVAPATKRTKLGVVS